MKKHFLLLVTLFSFTLFITNCGDSDVPGRENEEEVIDEVTLIFRPESGDPIIATATDEDGDGPLDFTIDDIELLANTAYSLDIHLLNTVAAESITEEVIEEADEHLFFFAFTNNIFADPTGNGNVDNRSDAVNYEDEDDNGEPLGQVTSWTTGGAASGTFRVILKHQPGLKSASSTSQDGESDIDITWTLNISNPS